MTSEWLIRIQDAEKTAFIDDGKKKVHYKFTSGDEMAEEYNLETRTLTRRAWKRKGNISKKEAWETEVGDPESRSAAAALDSLGIEEASDSPYIIKRVTKTNLEWRIRNLPYPPETYSVTAEPDACSITVRTSNKKYFKKIKVEELERVSLLPEQANIQFSHKFNTLIIMYKKPKEVMEMDKSVWEEVSKVQTVKDGDLPCKPS